MSRFTATAAALAAVLMPAAATATAAPLVAVPKLSAASALQTAERVAAPARSSARTRTKARAAERCGGADAPATARLATRRVVLCLLNVARADRGLRPLRHNARLASAARRHSADMVARKYFSHTSPAGASMSARILGARYVTPGRGYSLGENIAWGAGTASSPRAIMAAWMASPGHRANILARDYREVGIGIVRGTPQAGAGAGATYTTDFGTRG